MQMRKGYLKKGLLVGYWCRSGTGQHTVQVNMWAIHFDFHKKYAISTRQMFTCSKRRLEDRLYEHRRTVDVDKSNTRPKPTRVPAHFLSTPNHISTEM